MSIDQPHTIDFISVESDGNTAELTISDHLDWRDQEEHISALQRKVYRYLDFIESGEISRAYPNAHGKALKIRVLAKHPLTDLGREFIDHLRGVVASSGVALEHECGEPS